MSGLLNKLTGHSSDKTADHTTTHGAHGATTTTSTHTTTGTGLAGTTTGANTTGLHSTNTMGTNTMGTNTMGTNTTGTHQSGMTDNAMTRSEEQLRVQKATVESGKAELNKYVTTEHVSQAVPVTSEKVVVEREPINASNVGKAMSGPAISEAHYEVGLKKDIVTAEKEAVPIERIRLAKQTETAVETVGADLRKEHVELSTNTPDKVDLGNGRTVGDKVGATGTTTTGAHTTTH